MATPVSRRTALTTITSGLIAFWALATATVTEIFLSAPFLKTKADNKIELGKITAFTDEFKLVQVAVDISDGWRTQSENVKVYVRLNEQSELDILSARCSHLGCSVNWDEENREFICPCHAGRYSEEGTVLAGPPPAPLPRMEAIIEDETVYVNLA